MQVNLSLNLDTMTEEQRESFLTFLMIYYNINFGTTSTPLSTSEFDVKVKGFEDTLNPQVLLGTPSTEMNWRNAPSIVDDVEEPFDPQVLFGVHAVTPYNHAPNSAVAVPLPIAPVVTLEVTSAESVPSVPVPPPVQLELVPQVPAIPTNPVGVDNTGLPWDGRIHSSTKGKNKDGNWTARRGLDKDLGAKIEAELRGVMSLPNTRMVMDVNLPVPNNGSFPQIPKVVLSGDLTDSFAQMPPVNLTPPNINPAAERLASEGYATPPPPIPPVPFHPLLPIVAPAPPSPVAGAAPGDFAKFTAKIIRHINEKYITKAEVDSVMANYGISSMPLLINRPDLIPQISDAIDMFIQCK